jgi:hypothetical protein
LAEVKLIARGNLQLAECRCSAAASYFDRLVEPGVSEAAPYPTMSTSSRPNLPYRLSKKVV